MVLEVCTKRCLEGSRDEEFDGWITPALSSPPQSLLNSVHYVVSIVTVSSLGQEFHTVTHKQSDSEDGVTGYPDFYLWCVGACFEQTAVRKFQCVVMNVFVVARVRYSL